MLAIVTEPPRRDRNAGWAAGRRPRSLPFARQSAWHAPIKPHAERNLHAYVANDPVNLTDASGLTPEKDMPPPKCVGYNNCLVTGSHIPNGVGGICGGCSGYSIQIGSPNYAALARGADIPWSFAGTQTSSGITGTVTFGGKLSGVSLALNAVQSATLFNISYQTGGGGQFGGAGASESWIPFANLKDHWRRHGEALGTRSPDQYGGQAEANVASGRPFRFTFEGQTRLAHITRLGADAFMFTSTNLAQSRIFTHMRVEQQYLSNIGITLPRGF